MKVVILTEGSTTKGFGHIARCYSLCQAFQKHGVFPELVVSSDENVGQVIGYDKCELADWCERDVFSGYLGNTDIIIIDSYLAEVEMFKAASEAVATCVYIDDNNRIPYPPGMVLNGTAFAEIIGFPENDRVEYLLGTRYMPLRSSFWEVSRKRINPAVEKIMITFGGDDARGMTPEILGLLTRKWPGITKVVIMGKGFRTVERIERIKDDKTRLVPHPDAEGMKQIMLEADLAISAAGQTTYELARVGVPTIAIGVIDNQLDNIRGWLKAGFIEYAGWWEDANLIEKVEEAVEQFQDVQIRKARSVIGRRSIDGKGSVRVVDRILEKHAGQRTVPGR